MTEAETLYAQNLSLWSFEVELHGIDVNPQFVNPTTLGLKGVVPERWELGDDVRIGINESHFNYTNGVSIDAFGDMLSFEQRGSEIDSRNILIPELVNRYAQASDSDNWIGISLGFRGIVKSIGQDATSGPLNWPGFSDRLVHDGIQPGLQTHAFYDYSDRGIAVNLLRYLGLKRNDLSFFVQVHRQLEKDEEEQTKHQIESILSGWESDWKDAQSAVTRVVKATIN